MKYKINYNDRQTKINKDIYGHFSEHIGRCIYDGIWVGKDSSIPNINGVREDIINALRKIRVPVLRWPGGCYADMYHWMDGIGKPEERKRRVNKIWGGVVEDNSFGTHEFMDMCEEIGCEAYLSGNLGSGTIQEMSDWVDYITDPTDSEMANLRRKNGRDKPWKIGYFGIGNECWGCGGQMRPEYYADQYRQAAQYIRVNGERDMANMFDKGVKVVASGPDGKDTEWTDVVINSLTKSPFALNLPMDVFMTDGMSMHYYVFGGENFVNNKPAYDFDDSGWYRVMQGAAYMENMIQVHDEVMDKYDPNKGIGLMVDEWGGWHAAEPGTHPMMLFQQNTMRDAVLAGITLNIFNKRSDRVKLATIAQMINVLQSVILTEGEKMLLTPTYHIFDMYKDHQNAILLGSEIENRIIGKDDFQVNQLFESSSVQEDGSVLSTICNTSIDTSETIKLELAGTSIAGVTGQILCDDPHAYNTFDEPDTVSIRQFDVKNDSNTIEFELPAASVVSLKIEVCNG